MFLQNAKTHRSFLILGVLALLGLMLPVSIANAQTTNELLPFTGQWSGQLSGTTVTLDIFENNGLLNATTWFGGVKQNLEYLGFKSSLGPYFWREADKACICLFFEAGQLTMTYFEADSVRKIILSPQ